PPTRRSRAKRRIAPRHVPAARLRWSRGQAPGPPCLPKPGRPPRADRPRGRPASGASPPSGGRSRWKRSRSTRTSGWGAARCCTRSAGSASARTAARSADEAAREVAALLEQVRLTPAGKFLPKFPHELSGGQRQRVSFARALAARPSVLLADEPVSMLDVSIRLEMLSLLDDLRRRFQLALLYITHDIASARYFADEVLVMYGGEIVERGPAEELTQRPAHPYTQLLVASAP